MLEEDSKFIELECSDDNFNAFNRNISIEQNWNYLKTLLQESDPLSPVDRGILEILSVEFPIAHSHYLHINELIPSKYINEPHIPHSNHRLRPSTKLLCRVGRSMVAEQYRRMNLGKVKLEGVKPKIMTVEALQRERELLQRTLPGVGVAIARLWWRTKDLGDLYEQTCVKEDCCFHSYSYEHLIKHLKMGHYVLKELLDFEYELDSPSLFYPLHELKVADDIRSIYLCQRCDSSFDSRRSIIRIHKGEIADGRELNALDRCEGCKELVEARSLKQKVCQLNLVSSVPKVIWNEIDQYFEYDPARAIGDHVLESLKLFPNEKSPLSMSKEVYDSMQARFENSPLVANCHFMPAISALRGSCCSCGMNQYKGAMDKILDIVKLEKSLSLNPKDSDHVIDENISEKFLDRTKKYALIEIWSEDSHLNSLGQEVQSNASPTPLPKTIANTRINSSGGSIPAVGVLTPSNTLAYSSSPLEDRSSSSVSSGDLLVAHSPSSEKNMYITHSSITPHNDANQSGYERSNATRDVQTNNEAYICKYCGMHFEKLEILLEHRILYHRNADCTAKSSCTKVSVAEGEYSGDLPAINVSKGPINLPKETTSGFPATSKRSILALPPNAVIVFNNDLSQNETPMELEESDNITLTNERELMCPVCKFTSTSRELILMHTHIMD
nr:hypothetical protein HmN_000654300 [Hymenolepis microstoma]